MKEISAGGLVALILCVALGILLFTALYYYLHRKSMERQRLRALCVDRAHGKIVLPGIRHPNNLVGNQEYSVYFPEMAQEQRSAEDEGGSKSPINIINSITSDSV